MAGAMKAQQMQGRWLLNYPKPGKKTLFRNGKIALDGMVAIVGDMTQLQVARFGGKIRRDGIEVEVRRTREVYWKSPKPLT